MVAISDRRPHGAEKLQPYQGDLLQVLYSEDEVRGLGRLQSRQRGPCPAKGTAQHGKSPEVALFLCGFRTFLGIAVFLFAAKQALCYVPEGYFHA